MSDEHLYDKERVAFAFAVLFGFAAAYLFTKKSFGVEDAWYSVAVLGNVKTYVLVVALWIAVSAIALVILRAGLPKKCLMPVDILLIAASFAAGIYMTYNAYQFLGLGARPKYLITFILYAIAIVTIYSFYKKQRFQAAKTAILVAETGYFAWLWFRSCCYQNTFVNWTFGTLYNVYHTSAYIDTISNVYYGHPFTGLESELYGHYGLFFILPMKIFGANTKTIGTVMGCVAALAFICYAMSMILSFRQFFVKFTAIAALGLYAMLDVSIYWQSFPHRLIFPAIAMFVMTLTGKLQKFKWWTSVICLLISAAAFVWNFETGVLSAIALGVVFAMPLMKGKKRFVVLPAGVIINVAVSACLALLVLNIYNRTHGGEALGFTALLGYAKNAEFVTRQSAPIGIGNSEYIHLIIMCMVCALWSLWKMLWHEEVNAKSMFALGVTICGMGIATYYINDCGGGPSIIIPGFILIASVGASGIDTSHDIYSMFKKAFCVYCCTIIFIYGALGRNFRKDVEGIEENGARRYYEFQAWADEVNASIAPDTVGGGYGTTALFLAMGRDRETEDFHFSYEDVEGADHFIKFWSEDVEFEGYEVVDHFSFNGTCFGYFEKVDS